MERNDNQSEQKLSIAKSVLDVLSSALYIIGDTISGVKTMSLRITQIKPNPSTKSSSRYDAKSVAKEWVDIRNVGYGAVSLEGISIYHRTYDAYGNPKDWESVFNFSGSLDAGKTVRVHSGQKINTSELDAEDRQGADYHLFRGTNQYVWNNNSADHPSIVNKPQNSWVDQAHYKANPPRDKILQRSGDDLI